MQEDIRRQATALQDHGAKSGIGTTTLQLTAVDFPAHNGVLVRASTDNTNDVFIGNADVTRGSADATDGIPIEPGDAVFIEIDNPNKLFVTSATADQKVFWVAT